MGKKKLSEEVADFRRVTSEYCKKRKLCNVSADAGKLHCAKPAVTAYRSKDEKRFKKHGFNYLCPYHAMMCAHIIPPDCERVSIGKTAPIATEIEAATCAKCGEELKIITKAGRQVAHHPRNSCSDSGEKINLPTIEWESRESYERRKSSSIAQELPSDR